MRNQKKGTLTRRQLLAASALAAIAPTYLGARGLRSGLMAKRKTAGRF